MADWLFPARKKFILFSMWWLAASSAAVPLRAGGDCGTATSVFVSPAAAAYTCTLPAAYTFSGASGVAYSGVAAGCAAGSAQEAWFRFDPADPNSPAWQHSIQFEVSFNLAAGSEIKYYLLYSDCRDNGFGNPCTWVNPNTPPFTPRIAGCWNVPAGASNMPVLTAEGLDGEGTYFLKLERVSGAGGSIQICAKELAAPAPPPANDRCADAIALIPGAGVDPGAAAGGSGNWGDAVSGSTLYATKERRTDECAGFNTEDHFFTTNFLGDCYSNRSLGDLVNPITNTKIGQAVRYLDNSVYYTFTKPAGDPETGWYLHLGDLNCATAYAPDSVEILVARRLDCGDAANTLILSSAAAGATALFPGSDMALGPLTLKADTLYGIILDGVMGSGCDFRLLLTRSGAVSPVLEAAIPMPPAPEPRAALYGAHLGGGAWEFRWQQAQSGPVQWTVRDLGGRIVYAQTAWSPEGAARQAVSLAGLAPGLYLVQQHHAGGAARLRILLP
ncbi:MAG: hypothetical protein NW241_08635 [Bacteroidia bacterium]|nr:hypothetical protein [Bacteroidia bacterium]